MKQPASPTGRLVAAAALVAAVCAARGANSQTLFSNQTTAQGVNFTHHALPYPEDEMLMGAGGAWGDFDGDDNPDLYVADRIGPNRLFHNDGHGLGFDEVAGDYGVADQAGDSTGALWGDYDDDGDQDLYVLNRGDNIMFRNDGPDGSGGWLFTDVTAALGVECFGRTSVAVYGDYDNDGWLDMYVGNHRYGMNLPPEAGELNREDCLFHNQEGAGGQRTFSDKADAFFGQAVLDTTLAHSAGFFDYDDDGDLDLLVVNEKMQRDSTLQGNFLWRNDGAGGPGGWLWTDVTGPAGVTQGTHPMGLAIGDYNNDAKLDYALSDVGPNRLYHNDGDGTFTNRAPAAGVARPTIPGTPGDTQIGWGLVFFDFNLDTFEDLYVATGHLSGNGPQPNPLFDNDGNPLFNTFTEVTDFPGEPTATCADIRKSRTVIKADYDRDGDEDLYVVNWRNGAMLCRNEQPGGDYLALKLVGTVSNRDAIGARVTVSTSGLVDQHRMVQSGSTTSGGHDLTLILGMPGRSEVDLVSIAWPSGLVEEFFGLPTNERHVIEEGSEGVIFADGFESGDVSDWSTSVP